MKLSDQQLALIAQAQSSDFLTDTFVYFYQRQPQGSEDESALQDMARLVAKAQSYGLQTQVAWFDYLHTAYLLGRDFDTNPAYPWAAAILKDRDHTHKGERLFKASWVQMRINQAQSKTKPRVQP